MPNDKSPRDSSSTIPPPLDPFPTYQTPYPRSDKDTDNPFIQFRRAADETFSSFFQGIPQLFGVAFNDNNHWKQSVDETMRRRHELEEGWRKQFEQEMEEMRQELERSRVAATKAFEEAFAPTTKDVAAPPPASTSAPAPWWTKGNAARCPALNGTEPQSKAKSCPALYDEAGQPKTELDLYERSSQSATTDAQSAQETSKTSQKWSQWLTPGDLKSREASSSNNKSTSEDGPTAQATRYSMFGARRMDPFDNPDHTIPWLMLSPYSPIYLCNPSQARMFRVKIQDSTNTPLQISRPRFFDRWYSEVDEKLANTLPWADAFEDLVSLQQTGQMVDRNYSTLRTPPTWIHDMVNRGSLGDRWGFNDDGLLVKRANGTESTEAISKNQNHCGWRKERRWGNWKNNKKDEKTAVSEQEQSNDDNSLEKFVDDITEPLAQSPVFGGLLATADAIVNAVERTLEDVGNQIQDKTSQPPVEPKQNEETEISREQEETGFPPYSSSSSSSYSYSSEAKSTTSLGSQDSNSIISTMTSTITRTLPDGSIETKRVLKKRFADGSEETNESTEVQNAQRKSFDKQTQTTVQNDKDAIRAAPQTEKSPILTEIGKGKIQKAIEQAKPDAGQPGQVRDTANISAESQRRGNGWFWTK